jgi:hypothetical protein
MSDAAVRSREMTATRELSVRITNLPLRVLAPALPPFA